MLHPRCFSVRQVRIIARFARLKFETFSLPLESDLHFYEVRGTKNEKILIVTAQTEHFSTFMDGLETKRRMLILPRLIHLKKPKSRWQPACCRPHCD
ncbi:MAG: hypothetical protein R2875_12290 [Desulfobacterales bacterium]